MSFYFAASLLAAQLAAAPAGLPVPAAEAQVPADWASPRYDARVTREAVREFVADANAKEEVAASQRFSGGPRPVNKSDAFAREFDDAAVPGCLGPNALKHQPPKIGPVAIGGILALPFLVVAAVRGKCN